MIPRQGGDGSLSSSEDSSFTLEEYSPSSDKQQHSNATTESNATLHATPSSVLDASTALSLPVLRLGVNEAIERLGFGPFQWLLLLLCGCIYVADSMEIMLLSFLSQTLKCEWKLEDYQEASLSTGMLMN
jgi:hypothetical protein